MTRPMILIVDDEAQILRFLGHALAAAGYDTCTATTGAEALLKVASARPDLMVLDLGLPDMDGKAVIETLRKTHDPVSYTHLDVYKRQAQHRQTQSAVLDQKA